MLRPSEIKWNCHVVPDCPLHRGLFLASSSPLSYFLVVFFFRIWFVWGGRWTGTAEAPQTPAQKRVPALPKQAIYGSLDRGRASQEKNNRKANPHRMRIPHWQISLLAEKIFVTPKSILTVLSLSLANMLRATKIWLSWSAHSPLRLNKATFCLLALAVLTVNKCPFHGPHSVTFFTLFALCVGDSAV